MYYNISLKLIENNKWSSSFIDILAKDLKREFPTLNKMFARNLRYMQKFTTEFKPEYAGKLNFYLSAVDKYIKYENDNPTFEILLYKDKKKVTAQLALKDINKPIGVCRFNNYLRSAKFSKLT